MATSGTTTYGLTAREVITYALRKINLVADGEDASAESAERARIELNDMLKTWQRHASVWRLTEGSLTPVANTASISLSSLRPHRIIDCRYRNTSGTDLPMNEMTRQEYHRLPVKTTTGTPTNFYFDPQRDVGTLYIWPVLATVSTETIQTTYQRRFEDVTDLGETLDIAQDAHETVKLNLAARLADDYGRSGAHIDRVIQRAAMLYEDMMDADRPEVVRFVPERRWGRG